MPTGPILYFVEGDTPTNEEFKKAEPFMKKGPFLEFVSLKNFDPTAPLVNASGVAGKVPEEYKNFTIVDAKDAKPIEPTKYELVEPKKA